MAVTQGDEISRRIFDKRRPSYAHGWWEKVSVIIETVEPGTSAWAMGAAVPSLSKVIQLGPGPCGSHNLRKSSRCVHVPEDTHAHVQRHARWDRCRPVSRKGKNTHTLICSSPPPISCKPVSWGCGSSLWWGCCTGICRRRTVELWPCH